MKTVCFISELETLYYHLTTLTFSILNMIITPPLQSEIRTHFSYVTSGKNQTRTYSYFTLSQRFAWCQLRPRGDLGEAGAEARRAGEAARRPGLLEATLLLSPSTEEPVMLCSSSSSLRSIIYYPWLMSRWCRPGCVRRGGWPPGRAVRLHPRSPRRGLPHIRWGPRDCLLMRGSGRWRWGWNTLAGSFVTRSDVTRPEQSGLQVYMPAYSLKLMFTAEKCHLLSRLSKSWLNLAAMNIHLNLTLAFHPCHFSK